jgi:hypothetical protein
MVVFIWVTISMQMGRRQRVHSGALPHGVERFGSPGFYVDRIAVSGRSEAVAVAGGLTTSLTSPSEGADVSSTSS